MAARIERAISARFDAAGTTRRSGGPITGSYIAAGALPRFAEGWRPGDFMGFAGAFYHGVMPGLAVRTQARPAACLRVAVQ
ncbi:MAG: hypothetical protein CL814_01705 [Confluentimicrobium sp.]|nr:hypothetical protein [Actibacterium sp.]